MTFSKFKISNYTNSEVKAFVGSHLTKVIAMLRAKKKPCLIAISAAIVVGIGISFLHHNHESSLNATKDANQTLVHQLSEMNKQLDEMVLSIKDSSNLDAINNIKNEMKAANANLATNAKSEDLAKINTQLSTIKMEVMDKIDEVKQALLEQAKTKEYLDAASLPFQVVSVDVIGNQPYVSVDFDHHIAPLGVGDLLAGWRVVSLNYDSNEAQFVNAKNQYVKVAVQG